MRWRTFWEFVGVVKPQPVRTPDVDGLRTLYEDALLLVNRAYAGKPWRRRDLAGKMTQARWQSALRLMRYAGILTDDRVGVINLWDAPHIDDARAMLRDKVREWRREAKRNRHFVPPLP